MRARRRAGPGAGGPRAHLSPRRPRKGPRRTRPPQRPPQRRKRPPQRRSQTRSPHFAASVRRRNHRLLAGSSRGSTTGRSPSADPAARGGERQRLQGRRRAPLAGRPSGRQSLGPRQGQPLALEPIATRCGRRLALRRTSSGSRRGGSAAWGCIAARLAGGCYVSGRDCLCRFASLEAAVDGFFSEHCSNSTPPSARIFDWSRA